MSDRPDATHDNGRDHLEVSEVVAYVHGSLSREARGRIEGHLADCETCRAEVVEAARGARSTSRRSRLGWLPVTLAAGLAGVLAVTVLARGPGPDDTLRFRDAPAPLEQERIPRIEVVSPPDGAPVSRDSARFVWRAAEPDAFYRFTLTDAAGDVLLRRDLADTTLIVGPEAPLVSGREYFWYVDTLLRTGQSATTDVRRFRVEPPSEP